MNETFADLGYNVGDTVRCVDNKSCRFYTTGKKYVLEGSVDSRPTIKGDKNGLSATWELVSRAVSPAAAKNVNLLWSDLTPEDKCTLLLAESSGETIQLFSILASKWTDIENRPMWLDSFKYRVKPADPVVVAHELFGRHGSIWAFFTDDFDTHKMTYNTIDGVIDCASYKMMEIGK